MAKYLCHRQCKYLQFLLRGCFFTQLKCLYQVLFSFNIQKVLCCAKKQCIMASQPANIGPQDVPRTSHSNVPRTFPEDPIWPSRGCPQLTSWGRSNLTSRGRPNLTSRGRLNLTSEGRPWEVVLGRPQDVLRTSPGRPWKHILGTMWGHLLDVPKFLFTFFLQFIRLTKSV